jgi:hypothetical protein
LVLAAHHEDLNHLGFDEEPLRDLRSHRVLAIPHDDVVSWDRKVYEGKILMDAYFCLPS